MIRVTFLGTGTSQGIPVIGSTHPVCLSEDPRDCRLRTSIKMEWEGHTCVIDCGPDFRYQMLRSKTAQLDSLLFTHEHADHTAGIDDIRPFYFQQKEPINVYASQRVISNLSQRFHYIFSDENKYPGAPSVSVHEVDANTPFQLGGKTIMPITVMHNQLPVLGYRVDNFAYLTDVKTIADTELQKLQNLDVLVLNALREEPHESHLNLEEALALVAKINPRQSYFTHISHLLGFHKEVDQKLPKNAFLAHDFLTIHLSS